MNLIVSLDNSYLCDLANCIFPKIIHEFRFENIDDMEDLEYYDPAFLCCLTCPFYRSNVYAELDYKGGNIEEDIDEIKNAIDEEDDLVGVEIVPKKNLGNDVMYFNLNQFTDIKNYENNEYTSHIIDELVVVPYNMEIRLKEPLAKEAAYYKKSTYSNISKIEKYDIMISLFSRTNSAEDCDRENVFIAKAEDFLEGKLNTVRDFNRLTELEDMDLDNEVIACSTLLYNVLNILRMKDVLLYLYTKIGAFYIMHYTYMVALLIPKNLVYENPDLPFKLINARNDVELKSKEERSIAHDVFYVEYEENNNGNESTENNIIVSVNSCSNQL